MRDRIQKFKRKGMLDEYFDVYRDYLLSAYPQICIDGDNSVIGLSYSVRDWLEEEAFEDEGKEVDIFIEALKKSGKLEEVEIKIKEYAETDNQTGSMGD